MFTRREVLRGLGFGVGAVIIGGSPVSLFDLMAEPMKATELHDSLDINLRRLLFSNQNANFSNLHVTQTSFGSALRILDAAAALITIFEFLGLDRSFSTQVDYREASQCRDYFRQHEAIWRRDRCRVFTDVERASDDKDVAYMMGGNISYNNANQ